MTRRRWAAVPAAVAALALLPLAFSGRSLGTGPGTPPDLSTAAGIQRAIDAIDAGYGPPAAEVALPPGLARLDRPVWLDRPGVVLSGRRSTRLRSSGAFPAVIAGLKRPTADWEARHTVALPDGGFGWATRGDSYLLLRDSGFDLGPWSGDSPQNSRLSGWSGVRRLRLTLSVIRDDPTRWDRQAVVTTVGAFDGTEPDPWRLACTGPDRLALDVKAADGRDFSVEWKAPAESRLDLDLTLDLDAGTCTVLQNGTPATFFKLAVPKGARLREPEAAEVCVGRGIPQPFDHGKFVLRSFALEADGQLLGSVGPLPAASGFQGLWRWSSRSGVWGYGLLLPAAISDKDAIDGTGLRNLSAGPLDGLPYGCGVLMGQALGFRCRDVRFLDGARGLDQTRRQISYVTRVEGCTFAGQHHACLNLDYGIATASGCRLQGYGPRYFVRGRATNLGVSDCFFAGSGPGLASAIRVAEAARTGIHRAVFDLETPDEAPPHLIHASLGRANGGATVVRVEDTDAAACSDAPVLLDDPWGGRGGTGVGPAYLIAENSFLLYAPRGMPAVARVASGAWSVVVAGPTIEGVPPVAPPPDPVPDPPPKPATGANVPLPPEVLALPLFGGPWDTPVDGMPAHPDSAAMIAHYPAGKGLNPVFGFDWGGYPQGIPYNLVDSSVPTVPITCQPPASWGVKPYTIPAPIPTDRPVSRQSPPDSHLLILCKDRKQLWEFWGTKAPDDPGNPTPGRWHATSGVAWDLAKTHAAQHAEGATSADAAGLPILPGVLAYDRLMGGTQRALRVSVPNNGNTPGWYKLPAHTTANANDSKPSPVPFGARVRLRTDFDRSKFPVGSQSRAILDVLARYGGIVADGTDGDQGWTIDGVPDSRWQYDGDLVRLRDVPATALEIVDDGLWGVAWDVQISPGPYKVGQPITITGRLLGPPPTTGQLELIPYPIPPSGRPGYMPTDPYRMLRPDPDRGAAWDKPATMTLIPKEAGQWRVNWQSQAGGNRGRKGPDGIVVQVGD